MKPAVPLPATTSGPDGDRPVLENYDIIFPVLLAGGSGTRLWPVSRELYPKQLVSFIEADSLIQGTIRRLEPVLDRNRVRIVCGHEHYHETGKQLRDIGLTPDGKIISEPCGRNTAPAILLALLTILEENRDALVFIFPADHVIGDVPEFHERLAQAAALAHQGHIVTFGIQPTYPETGYGYIEGQGEATAEALPIKRFVEKPDLDTAKTYIKAGNFFWNSGMFAFKGTVMLDEYEKLVPEMVEKMRALLENGRPIGRETYEKMPNISFDYAIMEKTTRGVVLPSDLAWSDIGSWKSLYDFLPKDDHNNVINGDVLTRHTSNCLILGHDRLIASNRLDNLVVVETADSVFVSDLDSSRDVKEIVDTLKHQDRKEYRKHNTETHAWGSSTVLEDSSDLKIIKRLISPGTVYRETFDVPMLWQVLVVRGEGMGMLNGRRVSLKPGDPESLVNPVRVSLETVSDEPLLIVETRLLTKID
ncbi:MAG: mannose-1-phosphate guanylyltransferase/mannose-6-phosphate isomerase [Deltaproteobacteria bacterium]|nr:MAG: mannose-1-phosphate guanylyltransferase/mannose-6-phosphate isomerase [Deltaproteobacteria bacterium]